MRLWQDIANVADRVVDWVDVAAAGIVVIHQALKGVCILGGAEQHAKILSRMLIDWVDCGELQAKL